MRIAANAASYGNLIDALTGKSPEVWRAEDMQFEIGIFYGSDIAVDVSNIASLTIEIKDVSNPAGSALVSKVVDFADMTASVDLPAWKAQTAAHATVKFSHYQSMAVIWL